MTIDELPKTMTAVQLTGFGGFDKLDYRHDVPVPVPTADQVLIKVAAAGVNNTDINTRTGWYSKSVRDSTNTGGDGWDADVEDDGGWDGVGIEFPRIQGADITGQIVAVGEGVDHGRVGQRVLVRTMQAALDRNAEATACLTIGSEIDGGFAEYCAVRSNEAFEIETPLTDVELASFPCAYSTAEGMLHRVGLQSGERVLITGASGGVGSAAVQLAKRRGAEVIAVSGSAKSDLVKGLGADLVIDREADLIDVLGPNSVDVVADVVAGPAWPQLLEVLRKQGRYVTAGAIAGPIVELDVRTLYLKDLMLMGCTFQPRVVFENLVSYIEAGELDPVVAATFPLSEIASAQEKFLSKDFVGKIVLEVG